MRDMRELVARLRDHRAWSIRDEREAADLIESQAARITELEAERDGYAAVIEGVRRAVARQREEIGPADDIPVILTGEEVLGLLASTDTSAAVQAIRDTALAEAAVIAEETYPLGASVLGDAPARIAAAIRSQQGGVKRNE